MNDFDIIAELKKNRWPLAALAVVVFILTLLLFSPGSDADADGAADAARAHAAGAGGKKAERGIMLDYRDPVFEDDRFVLTRAQAFLSRRAGTNMIRFENKTYAFDDKVLEDPYMVSERIQAVAERTNAPRTNGESRSVPARKDPGPKKKAVEKRPR